jgi:hypothetical protein
MLVLPHHLPIILRAVLPLVIFLNRTFSLFVIGPLTGVSYRWFDGSQGHSRRKAAHEFNNNVAAETEFISSVALSLSKRSYAITNKLGTENRKGVTP